MEDGTTVTMQVGPETSWAARLVHPGPLASTSLDDLRQAISLVSNAVQVNDAAETRWETGSRAEFWSNLELFLWNQLLPLQTSSGAYCSFDERLSPDSYANALPVFLGSAVTSDSAGLRINIPVESTGAVQLSEGMLQWKMETGYPQEGSLGFSFYMENTVNIPLLIRIPVAGSAGGQLLRNGSTSTMAIEEGYIRLDGPWKNGDHVEFRFGIPFSVRAQGQKPVERGYPSAPSISMASVWHGCRQLVPLPNPNETTRETGSHPGGSCPLALGVRKDGVLILRADRADHSSPFERPGDCFRSKDQPPRKLIARALAGSLPAPPNTLPCSEVTFTAFETSFDKGA